MHVLACIRTELFLTRLRLLVPELQMGDYQNYGPLLGSLNTRCCNTKDAKGDHNFDNHSNVLLSLDRSMNTVLYCTVLYCTVLYCTVLYKYNILYYTG